MPEYKKTSLNETTKEYQNLSESGKSLQATSDVPSPKTEVKKEKAPIPETTPKGATTSSGAPIEDKASSQSTTHSKGSNLSKRMRRPVDPKALSGTPSSEVGEIEGTFTEKLSGNISSGRGTKPLPREETDAPSRLHSEPEDKERRRSRREKPRRPRAHRDRPRDTEHSTESHSRPPFRKEDVSRSEGRMPLEERPRQNAKPSRHPSSASSLASFSPSTARKQTSKKSIGGFFQRLLNALGLGSSRAKSRPSYGKTRREANSKTSGSTAQIRRTSSRGKGERDNASFSQNRPPKLRRPPSRERSGGRPHRQRKTTDRA